MTTSSETDVPERPANHTAEKQSDSWVAPACPMPCSPEHTWRLGAVLSCNQDRHALPGNGLIAQFLFHAQGQTRQFVG